MHRTEGAGHSANTFTDGNPGTATPATTVEQDWLNAVQEEMAYTIEQAGLVLDKADNTQFKQAVDLIVASNVIPVGGELTWYSDTAPLGWLIQDGAEYSMTTYNKLDAHLAGKTALDAGVVCTFDDAAETANAAGHGLADDTIVRFSNSGGALPAAITARYARFYVVNATANTYQLSLTKAGAPIDIVGTGTGVHSFHVKFAVPDPRGRVIRITDGGAGVDPDAGTRTDRGDGVGGDVEGSDQDDALQGHKHNVNMGGGGGSVTANYTTTGGVQKNILTDPIDGGYGTVRVATESRMINQGRSAIIKY